MPPVTATRALRRHADDRRLERDLPVAQRQHAVAGLMRRRRGVPAVVTQVTSMRPTILPGRLPERSATTLENAMESPIETPARRVVHGAEGGPLRELYELDDPALRAVPVGGGRRVVARTAIPRTAIAMRFMRPPIWMDCRDLCLSGAGRSLVSAAKAPHLSGALHRHGRGPRHRRGAELIAQ